MSKDEQLEQRLLDAFRCMPLLERVALVGELEADAKGLELDVSILELVGNDVKTELLQ